MSKLEPVKNVLLDAVRDFLAAHNKRASDPRFDLPWGTLHRAFAEASARDAGWVTIDEGGWDGNLICHRDNLEDRAGKEYGSWEECCTDQGLLAQHGPTAPVLPASADRSSPLPLFYVRDADGDHDLLVRAPDASTALMLWQAHYELEVDELPNYIGEVSLDVTGVIVWEGIIDGATHFKPLAD